MKICLALLTLLPLAIFNGCSSQSEAPNMTTLGIDIGNCSVDGVAIGAALSDEFSGRSQFVATGEAIRAGAELTASGENLDSAFITIADFKGKFYLSGREVPITKEITPADVVELVGEPYWRDESDGEVILFYEFQSGAVELQFEFPDSKHLGFITLASDGVLADPEQRTMYGVTKDWPPK